MTVKNEQKQSKEPITLTDDKLKKVNGGDTDFIGLDSATYNGENLLPPKTVLTEE